MDASRREVYVQRIIAPLAVYAVDKLLDLPRIREVVERFEGETEERAEDAKRAVKRRVRNVSRRPVWFAAGATLTVAGIAVMIAAARR